MNKLTTISSLLLSALWLAAGCTVGEGGQPRASAASSYNLVDKDHDGKPDCVDLDGAADVDFHVCVPRPVDANKDGVPEGLDLDCDGAIDVPLDLPAPPSCNPLIDANHDGIPDGLDLDCDGVADYHF